MSEKSRREPEISRWNREMSRVDAIRMEMADAVRILGENGRSAAEENAIAARVSGLTHATVERLRWKKIKRVPADISDAIREALQAHNERSEARARHERNIITARLEALAAIADDQSDPDIYRVQVVGVVEQARKLGLLDRPVAKAD